MTTHVKQARIRRLLVTAAEISGAEDAAIDRLMNGFVGLMPPTPPAATDEDPERWDFQS